MELLEALRDLGVNIDEGLERMMGNVSLYERMLGKFVKMMKDSAVAPDFDSNDSAGIIEKAHSIKGASGNLSITPVYEAYSEVVSLLRNGEPEEARRVLKQVLPVQEEILSCIEKHM